MINGFCVENIAKKKAKILQTDNQEVYSKLSAKTIKKWLKNYNIYES